MDHIKQSKLVSHCLQENNLSRDFFWKPTVINRNLNDKTIYYVQCMIENNKVFLMKIYQWLGITEPAETR